MKIDDIKIPAEWVEIVNEFAPLADRLRALAKDNKIDITIEIANKYDIFEVTVDNYATRKDKKKKTYKTLRLVRYSGDDAKLCARKDEFNTDEPAL